MEVKSKCILWKISRGANLGVEQIDVCNGVIPVQINNVTAKLDCLYGIAHKEFERIQSAEFEWYKTNVEFNGINVGVIYKSLYAEQRSKFFNEWKQQCISEIDIFIHRSIMEIYMAIHNNDSGYMFCVDHTGMVFELRDSFVINGNGELEY